MSKIVVEKIDGLWNIKLIEDDVIVADETVQFDEERDEIIDLYSEDGETEVEWR